MTAEAEPAGMAIDWEEEDELEALLRRLTPRFEAILRRFRIPLQDSPDRIQNVMVHYLYKRSQIRNPAGWMLGALRRECLMYLRGARRSRTVAVDSSILELLGGSSVPDPERDDLRRRLGRWLDKLSYKCRKLLRLRYLEELDVREIAERTGYKPSSVDKVTQRCKEGLASKIAKAISRVSKRGTKGRGRKGGS